MITRLCAVAVALTIFSGCGGAGQATPASKLTDKSSTTEISPSGSSDPTAGSSAAAQETVNTAAYNGNVEAIKQHSAVGADLNEPDPASGSTPLITAATFDRREAVKALIEGGADLNLQNREGSTALHTAAFLCRTEIVEMLLKAGANKEAMNRVGSTALNGVEGPFEQMKPIYDLLVAVLGPLGLKLDYERIKATRPKIAEMLR